MVWERQADGQTWQGFGLEEMIPSMDGWEIWDITDMNDDGVIVGTGGFKDPNNPQAQVEGHGFMLVPMEIKKVISDQISGNDANKLPTGKAYVGDDNNPMLMASRTGVKTNVAVIIDIPSAFAPKMLVGVRKTRGIWR